MAASNEDIRINAMLNQLVLITETLRNPNDELTERLALIVNDHPEPSYSGTGIRAVLAALADEFGVK